MAYKQDKIGRHKFAVVAQLPLACMNEPVAVYVCWYNWCKKRTALGTTPAIAMGLASDVWPIDRLLS